MIPLIIGAGEFTASGIGSSFVHTAINFWLCDDDSIKIPSSFQPKPKRRKVSSFIRCFFLGTRGYV
jgi:hypothetical protein